MLAAGDEFWESGASTLGFAPSNNVVDFTQLFWQLFRHSATCFYVVATLLVYSLLLG